MLLSLENWQAIATHHFFFGALFGLLLYFSRCSFLPTCDCVWINIARQNFLKKKITESLRVFDVLSGVCFWIEVLPEALALNIQCLVVILYKLALAKISSWFGFRNCEITFNFIWATVDPSHQVILLRKETMRKVCVKSAWTKSTTSVSDSLKTDVRTEAAASQDAR